MPEHQEQLPNPAAVVPTPAAALPEPAPSPGVAVAAAPAEPTPSPAPVDPAPALAPETGQPPAETVPASEPSLLEKFDKEKPQEQPGEAKPGDQPKPVEPAPAQPAAPVPVNYEYTLPETLKMDDSLKGDVHKAFDAFRADPAKGAQGLIDQHAKTMLDYATFLSNEQHRIFNETRRSWVNEVMSDPQLGGSGHRTAMGAIARMRDQFVPEADRPAFEQFLRVTGAGDHPQFLKLLHNVSRFYDEPPLPPPNPKPTPTNGLPPKRGMRSLYNQSS